MASKFHRINKLQSVLDELLAEERAERRALFGQVLKQLRKSVEVCEERFGREKFFVEECDFYDTHRDSMERAFWSMGNSKDKRWKRVERRLPNYVFCHIQDSLGQRGMACVDKMSRQIVVATC